MSERSAFKQRKADDSPGFLLYRVTTLWQQKLGKVFDRLGVNQTQYAILASLKYFEEHGEQSTQAHLADHARIEKMTLSKSVRLLARAGLVERTASGSDRRAMIVRLTAAGRRLVVRAIRSVEGADEVFFGRMSRAQRSQFQKIALLLINGGT